MCATVMAAHTAWQLCASRPQNLARAPPTNRARSGMLRRDSSSCHVRMPPGLHAMSSARALRRHAPQARGAAASERRNAYGRDDIQTGALSEVASLCSSFEAQCLHASFLAYWNPLHVENNFA